MTVEYRTDGVRYSWEVDGRSVCYHATAEHAALVVAHALRCDASEVLPFILALGRSVKP